MYKETSSGKIDYDKASQLLGTVNEKTIKKHYERIEAMVEKTILGIAGYLSGIPSFASLPETAPSRNRYDLLEVSLKLFDEAGTRMRGMTKKTEPIVIVAKTYYEEAARKKIFSPLSFVSYLLYFHDTS
jgi:hypothetical protein